MKDWRNEPPYSIAKEVLKKHLCYGNPTSNQDHLGNSIEDYVFKDHILKAMQEFSQAQRLQARNEAIQECIESVDRYWPPDSSLAALYRKMISELEKFKK